MNSTRINALDQALDIAGSFNQNQTMTLTDEPAGLGKAIQNGNSALIDSISSGIVSISGLTGMSDQSVGRFLVISGANRSSNNGSFLITKFNSVSSVNISNAGGIAPDPNNGSISWTERNPYSLEDDLNYTRTDRQQIKGTTNWYETVPVYQRPTATSTNVFANLKNIAGKTTDAQGFIFPRIFRAAHVNTGNNSIIINSTNNFRHSDSSDKTGVPCFDTLPYFNDYYACFVLISDPKTDMQLTATGGSQDGYVIFGLSKNGGSSSPNSIQINFYAVPHGTDLNFATPYTWDGYLPNVIDLTYGYFLRLDQADEDTFMRMLTLGGQSSGGDQLPRGSEIGQFLYVVESSDLKFIPAKPLINEQGYIITNDDAIIVVIT